METVNSHAPDGASTGRDHCTRNDAPLPVLIVGAGSSGLALAQGLQKNGIPVIAYEKDTCIDPVGRRAWAFVAAWSAPILRTLLPDQLWDRIHTAFSDPSMPVKALDFIPLTNGATGERIGEVPLPGGHRFFRPRFRKLVAEGLDIRFGKELEYISYEGQSVKAHFNDGSSATGRLLVGADGSRSCVRKQLLGPQLAEVDQLPFGAIFINARYTREQALLLRNHPLFSAILHPNGSIAPFFILDALDPDRPEDWTFMMYISWKVQDEGSAAVYQGMSKRDLLRTAKQLASVFCEPARSAFSWVPDDASEVYFSRLTQWDPRPAHRSWDNHGGLVTLIGDAAHPMTHQRGQGLNHAIDDAGSLTRLLSTPQGRSSQELIDAYELEMRSRAGKEVELSELNTRMLHDWSQMMKSPFMTSGFTKSKPVVVAQKATG